MARLFTLLALSLLATSCCPKIGRVVTTYRDSVIVTQAVHTAAVKRLEPARWDSLDKGNFYVRWRYLPIAGRLRVDTVYQAGKSYPVFVHQRDSIQVEGGCKPIEIRVPVPQETRYVRDSPFGWHWAAFLTIGLFTGICGAVVLAFRRR